MKTKEMFRWLKKQAEILPPDTYDIEYKFEPYKVFNEDNEPMIRQLTPFPINHGRRICNIFKKEGLEGVNNYFKKYGFEFKTI